MNEKSEHTKEKIFRRQNDAGKPPSENINKAISELRKTQPMLIEMCKKMYEADNRKMFGVDLLAVAAMNRTVENTEGFLTLVESKNMSSASALLRIQLDTCIRFHSIWLVDKPHDFANKFMAGEHIRKIKDKDGKKMTDGYLIDVLSKDYPWLRNVYNDLSGYVHFSGSHLFGAIHKTNTDTGEIVLGIGKNKYPESSWIEAVDCFTEAVAIFLYYLSSWIATKNG